MGEVLEMIRQLVVLCTVALGVAGCASDAHKQTSEQVLFDSTKALLSKGKAAPLPRAAVEQLTRDQLIGIGGGLPMILVDVELSQAYATLSQVAQNGQYATFQAADAKTLTFSKGLMTATRGMGADLMSLDVSQTRAALQAGARGVTKTQRTHRFLNAENELRADVYNCDLENQGTETLVSIHKTFRLQKYQETCHLVGSDNQSYTNSYWINPTTKTMWKSRQWPGSEIGTIGIEVLVPENS